MNRELLWKLADSPQSGLTVFRSRKLTAVIRTPSQTTNKQTKTNKQTNKQTTNKNLKQETDEKHTSKQKQNQHTRELISARKTSHKHNVIDLSDLR